MIPEAEIVGRLGSPNENERKQARESLDSLGPNRALKLLVEALGDERWRIRKTAIEMLEAYPDSKAVIELLIPLLGEKSETQQRNSAIELLTRLGEKAVPALLEALRGQDSHARKLSADILGQIAHPKAEPYLIESLDDTDENVRMAVVEALGNYRSEPAFRALLDTLKKGDLSLKFCALESIAKTGREIPLSDIKPLAEQKILRRAVLDALAYSSSIEAVKILASALKDESASSRHSAIRSLGVIIRNNKHLMKKIKDEIAKAVEPARLFPILLEALEATNRETQKGGLRIMGAVGIPDGVTFIVEAARDSELSADAMEALQMLAQENYEMVSAKLPPVTDPVYDLVKPVIEKVREEREPAKGIIKLKPALQMTEAQFNQFRDYLNKFCGIHFKEEMKFILENRLLRRMELLGLSSFDEYLNLVMYSREGKEEINEAINILTTNETYFFRENFQLRAFAEEILPLIHKNQEKNGEKRLRVFSAGCSSGEEPYTLAMLLDESPLFRDWNIKIVGGDISERVLTQAKEGIYKKSSFRTTPQKYIEKYFVKKNNDTWRIVDKLREKVEFHQVNLFERSEVEALAPFDIIFCRNVIIYFDLSAKKKVIDILFDVLKSGGYLLLGHSESLVNITSKFDLVHLKNDMVYRKPASSWEGLK